MEFVARQAIECARMFGSSDVAAIDLLQALVLESRAASGIALARSGLSERLIIDWRRQQLGQEPTPILSIKEQPLGALVQDVLDEVRATGPIFYRQSHHALTALALLSHAAEDELLADVLRIAVADLRALMADLRAAVDDLVLRQAPSERDATAYLFRDAIAFVLAAPTEKGLHVEVPASAHIERADASDEVLGRAALDALSRSIDFTGDLPDGVPYHEAFGFKTPSQVQRRSRAVGLSQSQASVAVSATIRRRGARNMPWFEGLLASVSLRVPADRPAWVGHALQVAFANCIDGA